MERAVKSLKKSLDVLAKRKVNYKTNRFLYGKLGNETEFLKVPTYNYHKNVTKVSRESDNRRSMMYPVCKLNTLVHFTNKAGDTPSAFTIKWYEDKLVREAGIYGVYIYADPEESEDIYFITIYSLLIGGKPTKSLKTTITKFNFDNNEVVKMGDTTTLSESLKSVEANYVRVDEQQVDEQQVEAQEVEEYIPAQHHPDECTCDVCLGAACCEEDEPMSDEERAEMQAYLDYIQQMQDAQIIEEDNYEDLIND